MKRVGQILVGLSGALGALYFAPIGQADVIYDFSVNLTIGTPGTLTGTIDLPCVGPGGTGTCGGTLTITSTPAGIGALAGGNIVTAWANQVENSFVVIGGAVETYDFFADTGPAGNGSSDYLCLNFTGNVDVNNKWDCGSLDGIAVGGGAIESFSEDHSLTPNVSFTPVAVVPPTGTGTVPEPSSSSLLLIVVVAFGIMAAVRKRKPLRRSLVS